MLRTSCPALLLASALIVTGCTKAKDEAPADKPAPGATQPEKTASTAAMNTVCPISGDPVSATGQTVAFQGQAIGFCCDDCIDSWNSKTDEEKLAFVKKQTSGS